MTCDVMQLKVSREKHINYSYIIFDAARNGVLVDPAWEFETITQAIKEHQLKIDAVLITHEHYDHIDLATLMSIHYNSPIYISPEAANNTSIARKRLVLLKDESHFMIGALKIKPVMTPGHTKGSICFLINGHLFTGDTLFSEGCGMCWGESSSASELFHSLRRLVNIIPTSTIVHPGHKYVADIGLTFGEILKNNIYLNIDNEDIFVSFRMRSGQSGLTAFS